MDRPRIAIPLPTSGDPSYNERCWQQYAQAVEQSGGRPILVDLDQTPAEIAGLAASCSGVLLPGSPADICPQRYGQQAHAQTAATDVKREAADELLLQDAFNLHKPVLGICYGHQSMNVWRGGTLVQHLETVVDHAPGRTIAEAHAIELAAEARHVKEAFDGSQTQVNSSHHQAVATPGDGLRPVARVPEDGTLEAVESEEGFVVGVQWHPERTFTTHAASRRLFQSFVQAAEAWQVPASVRVRS